nr:reverse transcriptase domain-containing protein [Tanacetum cinerariifolium]
MLVEVGKFTFLVDFVILKMKEDSKVPLTLGRPFLHTADVVIRVKQKQLNLRVGTERMIFNIDSAMKHSYSNDDTCFSIDVINEILEEDFDDLLDEDLELKPLPDNLEYVFLEPFFLPVIISSQLSKEKKNKLISVLKKNKQAFAWKTTDIPGIFPSFCKRKIQLLDDKKPVVQKQRKLNPNMQEVVKKEIVKLLDTSIIYPIVDSPWVSPIHFVPKKGGITVVTNENDELVPTRTVTGWRVCIDYCKLNEATTKDHFPLSFMDQMRMPFGLCNAPVTFQRCMLAIFHDMIEESVEGCSSCPKLGKMSLHGQRMDCALTQVSLRSGSASLSQGEPKAQKDNKAKYKKMKAKLALLEASPPTSQPLNSFQPKNKGLVAEIFDWDEEEVSNDEKETHVKVLMALADDELSVGKNYARNGEWIDITMKKLNILLSMDEDSDWQNYLKYINIDL